MNQIDIIVLFSKLIFVGIAAFFAIIVWSRTREGAWMLMVAGTLATYMDCVFILLGDLGMIQADFLVVSGIPFARIFFTNLPYLFYALAFLSIAKKKKIS